MPEEISWDRNKHFPCGLVLLSVLDGSHSFPLPCGPGLLPRASHLSPQPQLFSEVARGGPGEQLMADTLPGLLERQGDVGERAGRGGTPAFGVSAHFSAC